MIVMTGLVPVIHVGTSRGVGRLNGTTRSRFKAPVSFPTWMAGTAAGHDEL
jgi:hypothetical protein